jgi:hypothetical protein
MHSWREMVKLLELTDRPKTVGFQADMAHTLLYTLGINAGPEDRIVPEGFNWDPDVLDESLRRLTNALRPWTIDFHVAQNDATVHGTGSHDKTGRHCQVNDPNGKLNIDYHAGFWLREENGKLTKAVQHICWDGCMFPNAVMLNQQTWNDILKAMITVRDAHGWDQPAAKPAKPAAKSAAAITSKPKKAKARPVTKKKKTSVKKKKAVKVKAKKTARKSAKRPGRKAAKKGKRK